LCNLRQNKLQRTVLTTEDVTPANGTVPAGQQVTLCNIINMDDIQTGIIMNFTGIVQSNPAAVCFTAIKNKS